MRKKVYGLLGVAAGIAISFLSPPPELTAEGMRYLGLFVWFVIWLAGGVLPEYMTGLGALALSVLLRLQTLPEAFAPFGSETICLLIGAFGIGHCLKKSGLLTRIAYYIMQFFPGTYTGQLLALYVTGIAVSPLMPSLTAKATMVCPLSVPISDTFGSEKNSAGTAGLFLAAYWSTGVLGNFFYSGSVYAGIIVACLSREQAAGINFASWLRYFWPSFLLFAAGGFLVIRLLYKPKEIQPLPAGFVREKLRDLGPMSRGERISGLGLLLFVAGCLTASFTGVSAGLCAMTVLFLLSLLGQFGEKDFAEGVPWSVVALVGSIISLAAALSAYNIPAWLCRVISPVLGPAAASPVLFLVLVGLLGFLLRWFVASIITTGTILFALLSGIAVSLGIHPLLVLFIGFLSAQNWPFPAFNTTFLASYGTVRNQVRADSARKMSFVFSFFVILAAILNLPIWHACGLM